MIVFDISSADSFAKAKTWVKELQRQGNPNMIMALTGNKADLADQRQVHEVASMTVLFAFGACKWIVKHVVTLHCQHGLK